MKKLTAILVIVFSIIGEANALPFDDIFRGIRKLFKGNAVEVASTARRATSSASDAKYEGDLVKSDLPNLGSLSLEAEPKPDLNSTFVAKIAKDESTYKSFRAYAKKGDSDAMIKMSDMISSGKISDAGEPWRGYWIFQAARLGNLEAKKRAREECATGLIRRTVDRWFDSACETIDGKKFFIEGNTAKASTSYSTTPAVKSNVIPLAR